MSVSIILSTLVAVSRNYQAKRRELCCPECGVSGILLLGGKLQCIWCEWHGERLAELAVKE